MTTLNSLISKLQEIQNEYGDIECVLSVDTKDTFNFVHTDEFDINVETFKKNQYTDNILFYRLNIHTEVDEDED